ncbi:MAG: Gfo/Idh/MocA family oxidoreductase [Verrucomicrobiae bacterium]|nr:Gfo/Idh/MocA family oxidoreductase [Verrucomicrobiae bacterium]
MKPFQIQVSRRNFLKAAAAGAGIPLWYLHECEGLAATPARPGPNDRPGIGLIGCGGQGRGVCNGARRYGQVIAVADVDVNQAGAARKQFEAEHQYEDFRKLIERDDIHVIINGAPDHWHTMINVAAARAGKDIYSEKPLTLTVDEGKFLVREVRQHERILQVGSQQRSDRRFRLACELVRNGRIGKLQHMIVGLPTGPREGPFARQPVPAGLNWDYYLGPTPFVDFNGRNHHWNFRWWYQFSGGQMTDWGAHHNDIAQWGNGTDRSGPVEVDGRSLVDMIPGGYDAAARYRIECRYANGVTMTILDENTPHERGVVGGGEKSPNGVQFLGSDGWIFVSRGELRASDPEMIETPLPANAVRLYASDNHIGNFFDGIRTRKEPICDAEIGHRSISIAHLGVISIRLGRRLEWNPEKEEIVGDAEANGWLSRPMRRPYDWDFIG